MILFKTKLLGLQNVYAHVGHFGFDLHTLGAYIESMQVSELPIRQQSDDYPTVTVRVTDKDRKDKLKALKIARVDISKLMRPTLYEMIDAAYDRLNQG